MPARLNAMNRTLVRTIFVALSLAAIHAATAAETVRTRDHMRNQRYGEVLVVTGGPFNFAGHVYNTLGLNDCPEAAWKALDPKQLAREFKARAVMLNGPRYFMMDKSSIANPGAIATFGGIQARHLADVKISLLTLLHGRAKAYTESVVKRTTEYVYLKGRPIYELLAPDGRVYVMQTYALIVDPNLTEADLATLGRRLKLPQGWKYRTRIPDSDLVLRVSGTAYVLQDDLENSYQRATGHSARQ
jgi:hypothetical protein